MFLHSVDCRVLNTPVFPKRAYIYLLFACPKLLKFVVKCQLLLERNLECGSKVVGFIIDLALGQRPKDPRGAPTLSRLCVSEGYG